VLYIDCCDQGELDNLSIGEIDERTNEIVSKLQIGFEMRKQVWMLNWVFLLSKSIKRSAMVFIVGLYI
jgi:hypothetical protein